MSIHKRRTEENLKIGADLSHRAGIEKQSSKDRLPYPTTLPIDREKINECVKYEQEIGNKRHLEQIP
ncbi:hypothetical protein ACJJIG_18590 [Microbulbifer sp. SSSA007]|uniref:hypothetical protein n=1 Tax=Microbulbifer sp. SSSA007 TaxID=3243379 RepID=UPI004039C715